MGVIRNLLTNHASEVKTYFAQNPSVSSYTFAWPIIPPGSEPVTTFRFGDISLRLAFGTVTITGQMQVTVQRSDLSVIFIEYEGSFTDLYDYNHNAGWPAPIAAKVQTGFFTLGMSGNVFFTTVEFNRQDSNFNFQFQ